MVEFEYNGGKRRKMSVAYANVLEKARCGRIVHDQPKYETRELRAEPKVAAVAEEASQEEKPRRKYKRRDLTAED